MPFTNYLATIRIFSSINTILTAIQFRPLLTLGAAKKHTFRFLGIVAAISFLLPGCDSDIENNSKENRSPQTSLRPLRDLALASSVASRPSGVLPQFRDVTAEVGVLFTRNDDMQGQHRLMEANGGGVALWDFDGDGWLDMFFTNGCHLPLLPHANSPTDELFRNTGTGRYEKVTAQAGINHVGYHQGCAVGDYDNDGFDDLYVSAYGENKLWHNCGDGTFHDVTKTADCDSSLWSTSCAFGDLNNDGLLDLFVVNYVDANDNPPRLCPHPGSPDGYVQCSPTLFPASPDKLFINNGEGGFRDVTSDVGVAGIDGKGLGIVLFDFNLDRKLDVFIANDGMPNFLYVNETEAGSPAPATPKFVERGLELGVALSSDGRARAGMGIACGDYDQDGWHDLLVTNFFAEPNTLFRNIRGTTFEESTDAAKLRVPSHNVLGFGTEFLDFDNDGKLDLFVANGHVDDLSWNNPHEHFRMPPQFFRNEGNGVFLDVSAWSGSYFEASWLGRGTAQGDWDRDGDIDLVVSHKLDPSAILRNDSISPAHSIVLKLIGRDSSNRSAIGSRCVISQSGRKLTRQVIGGGSFQSASSSEQHFGLGRTEGPAQLEITWPSGAIESFEQIHLGRWVIVEGLGLFSLNFKSQWD